MRGNLDSVLLNPERLAALFQLNLLDTPAEAAFDRLTRLAARILDVPVTLVSLVDDHRQFLKSTHGLPDPWASLRETPLTHSFCQHVVASGRPLVVDDAVSHPVLCTNLAVRDLHVAAYLGMPLITPEGYTIGSFCAVDTRVRVWSEAEQETMRELAASIMSEVSLGLANQSMEKQVRVRTAELKSANLALKEIEARYLNLVENSMQGVVIHRQFHILYANGALAELLGWAHAGELLGLDLIDALIAPAFQTAARKRLEKAYAGESTSQSPDWCGLHKDGREIWLNSRATHINWHGQPAILTFCSDVTERKLGEKRQHAMLAELDHRVKNVLARVGSVVSLSRIGATSLDGFTHTLEGRIQSLANAHQVLSMRNWNGANLAELIHAQLAPYGSLERTTVAGPEFFLNPDASHALAPVFHELVTNAAKYGSLTSPQGRISVSWQISATAAGDQLSIEWQESGGPVVPTPTRTGFGSQMIFEVIRFELRGTADLQFKPPGVACTLTIPLARVAIVPRTE